MSTIRDRIDARDWKEIVPELHEKGFVVIRGVLQMEECDDFIRNYNAADTYRKTVDMNRYRYGSGEYKYFQYPLPDVVAQLRESVYPKIVDVANRWMEELKLDRRFPPTHAELKQQCHEQGQTKPTALILKYGEGDFNALHQDLYGEIFFPMQVVLMLDQVGENYSGGEFVITEQIPRAQSKANVLAPNRGDMIIFTTNFRPVKSARGYTRVNMKHGVSPLHTGNRHTLGVIFHDAQ